MGTKKDLSRAEEAHCWLINFYDPCCPEPTLAEELAREDLVASRLEALESM